MASLLRRELEKLYPHIQTGNKTVFRKLLHLIERHPKNRQFKNYLSVAFEASGNGKKAAEI